jgi:hypothetical protein
MDSTSRRSGDPEELDRRRGIIGLLGSRRREDESENFNATNP